MEDTSSKSDSNLGDFQTNKTITSSLFKLLNSTKIENLAPYIKKGKDVVTVSTNDSLHDAFSKLMANSIHSVPIFDCSQNKFIGLLDISDFSAYLLLLFGGKTYPWIEWNCRDLESLSEKRPFRSIDSKLTVLNYLINSYWKGSHSIPVCKENNIGLFGMVSHSSLIQWLVDSDPKALGPEINLPLKDLKIGKFGEAHSEVISVQVDLTLLQVIDTLVCKNVNACAIVNSFGHLIGNISNSDLALVKEEDNMKFLDHPIHTYLSTFGLAKPITCTENDTLFTVMKKLTTSKIHRLYCITKEQTIQYVITLSDILDVITIIATKSSQIE